MQRIALAQRAIDSAHPPNKVDPPRDAEKAEKKRNERTLAPPTDGRGAEVDLLA